MSLSYPKISQKFKEDGQYVMYSTKVEAYFLAIFSKKKRDLMLQLISEL